MSIDALLDNDSYKSYLTDLSKIRIELYCKNFPPHLKNGTQYGSILLKGIVNFLNSTFEKGVEIPAPFDPCLTPATYFMFSNIMINNYIPVIVSNNCLSFTFKFHSTAHIQAVLSAGIALPKNFDNMNLFMQKSLITIINFPNNRMKPDHEELIQEIKKIEAKFIPQFDKIIKTLSEYIIYYDHSENSFRFELKD